MSEQTAQEPTMEEILASIRRIISEDDAPAETAAAAPAASPEPDPAPLIDVEDPEPAPAPSPALMDEPPSLLIDDEDDDVLELTDRYDEPAAETVGDIEIAPRPVEAPRAAPRWDPPAASVLDDDSLVSDRVAETAASAFAGLSQSLLMPAAGRTLEDVVREMLRPMLRDWLDQNLPGIVEAQVRAEVERISRRGAR